MVTLRQWQIEFLEFVKKLPEKSIVNLYDNGKSQGKSFLASEKSDLIFIEELEKVSLSEVILTPEELMYFRGKNNMDIDIGTKKIVLVSTCKLSDKKFNITDYYEVF